LAENITISEETRQIILKIQQKEVTEQAIYRNLSKRVKSNRTENCYSVFLKKKAIIAIYGASILEKNLSPKV